MFGVHQVSCIILITVLVFHTSSQEEVCAKMSHELFQCWAKTDNIKLCYDIVTKLINLCPSDATRIYINKVKDVINKTQHIISSILSQYELPNHSCLIRIKEVAYIQGQYILSGYSTPDGCAYRKLLSILAQSDFEDLTCSILIQKVDEALLLSNCSFSKKIERDSKLLKISMVKCFSLHSSIGHCTRQHNDCNKTHASITKCFTNIVANQTQCTEELLRRSITHQADTWKYALKYYCSDEFRPSTRYICERAFKEITSKIATIVPNFHSTQDCITIQLNLNHITSLSPADCRSVLSNYTAYLLNKSDCFHSKSHTDTIYFKEYYLFTVLITTLVIILFRFQIVM